MATQLAPLLLPRIIFNWVLVRVICVPLENNFRGLKSYQSLFKCCFFSKIAKVLYIYIVLSIYYIIMNISANWDPILHGYNQSLQLLCYILASNIPSQSLQLLCYILASNIPSQSLQLPCYILASNIPSHYCWT